MADVKPVKDTYVSEKNSDSDDDIPYFSDVEPMVNFYNTIVHIIILFFYFYFYVLHILMVDLFIVLFQILEKELIHGRECITNEGNAYGVVLLCTTSYLHLVSFSYYCQFFQSAVAKYKTKDAKRMIMRLELMAHSSFQRFMSLHEALAVFYSRRLTHYIKKTEVFRLLLLYYYLKINMTN